MSNTVELETPLDAEPPRIRRGIVETIVFRGLGLPLSFGISILTSRYLLPVGRGAYVLGLLTVTLAGTLLGNVGTGLVYEVSRAPQTANALLKRAIVLSVGLGVVGGAVLVPIDLALAQQDYRVVTLAVFGLAPLLVSQAVSSMLLAVGRVRSWNLVQLILPTATLVAMVVLVGVMSKGVTGATVAWVFGQASAAIFALYVTRRMWWPLRSADTGRRMRSILLLGLRIGVVNLVSLINYRVELVILELYRGLNGVGIYSLATSLAELLWLVSSAVSTALVAPAVNSDDERAVDIVTRGVRHVFVLTTVLAAGIAAIAHWFIPWAFGARFAPSVVPLLLLLPGVVAFAPASVLAVFFSMRLGRARYAFFMAIGSATTTCILAVVLIPRLGADGAALACISGYISSMAIALAWFVRLTGVSFGAFVPRPADVVTYRDAVRRVLVRT
jgi:O-antigen/teichoic acid export membrane protein